MTDLSIEERLPTVSEYQKIRMAVGWENTPDAVTETALNKSLFSVCAIFQSEIVGIGRIVGDDGLYFYIQDVVVLPEFQRQGIGTLIMEELIAYLDKKCAKQAFVSLKSAEGLISFYEKFGFSAEHKDIPGIFMVRN